ncbi:carboxymuconolactone decarboxylase family protein [Streptomyces sp. XM4193]|uniref:carboxymuconolactone decarboxylase family protein n=1 Tax=Streptomyces sp. XM4193 TaxID=2929782 RepID=UPI001FFA26BE|nr:carboxymuconolactone decarboxylase family protein [Streptomyces sp. XM4193]MCK1796502.1 carboxymuconolactone decarboxylase family protein [Streptomyces sp. XM4193]
MARISLQPRRTPLVRIGEWYARRRYGKVLDPLKAAGHHRGVLLATGALEAGVAHWKTLDPGLQQLAVMASAVRIGCSWCVDFGYWEGTRHGAGAQQLRHVPVWREHRQLYTALEIEVMEYAEAMTETEPAVTDAMAQSLVAQLGERAFVELTALVAVENMRSRTNAALGLVGQGFSDRCEIPPLPRPTA